MSDPAFTPEQEAAIDERVNAILASMGGDLLATYGQHDKKGNERPEAVPVLAALGGYFEQRFGRRKK